jgi:hypothetical protein
MISTINSEDNDITMQDKEYQLFWFATYENI